MPFLEAVGPFRPPDPCCCSRRAFLSAKMQCIQNKQIFLACVASCAADDRFHQEMFTQLSLGITPLSVEFDKSGMVFFPRMGTLGNKDKTGLLPEDLQARLQEYNQSYPQTPLTFGMLPSRIDIGNGRRISESMLQKQSWCWCLKKKDIREHVLAIPVLLEWHCDYRSNQQSWYNFIQLSPPQDFSVRTRNARIMFLLQLVQAEATKSKMQPVDVQRQVEGIYSRLQSGSITFAMQAGNVTGWSFSKRIRNNAVYILLPEDEGLLLRQEA